MIDAAATVQVSRDGLVFDVDVCGPEDGRPALLLHGFPQTAKSWRKVMPLLADVGVQCFAMTQRGYSPGARPTDRDAYAMRHLVADALAVTKHISPHRPLDLVGHDWGASVGWHLAAQHPDRVRSLTAISVPHLAAYGHGLRHDDEQRTKIAYMTVLRQDPHVVDQLLEHDQAGLRQLVGDRLPADALEQYLPIVGTPEGLRGAVAWYQANGRELHDLGPVHVPTTFLWGTEDKFIAAASARHCAQHVDAPYRYLELDGVSHWVPEEAPDTVARAIIYRLLST